MADLVGAEIYGYKLDKLVAIGGSSEIYSAYPLGRGFPREVIFKIAKARSDKLNRDLEYFAEKLWLIHIHPSEEGKNIIGLYNSGQYDGRFFLALEYMHHTFKDFVERRSLTIKKKDGACAYYPEQDMYLNLARITIQILQGLKVIHQVGLNSLHGDLTPSNILLDKEDTIAKLTDLFNPEIYKSTEKPAEKKQEDISSLVPVKEEVPEDKFFDARQKYLAPEQRGIISDKITGKADIYSLHFKGYLGL